MLIAAAVGSLHHAQQQAQAQAQQQRQQQQAIAGQQPPGAPTGFIINHPPGQHGGPRNTTPVFLNLSQLQVVLCICQVGGVLA